MQGLLLFSFLVVLPWAASGFKNGTRPFCAFSAIDIPLCALQLMDANNDYVITPEEWTNAAPTIRSTRTGLIANLNVTWVFELCDADRDGLLSVLDWTNTTSPCKLGVMQVQIACFICNLNLPYLV
jgi:hypothetical protein